MGWWGRWQQGFWDWRSTQKSPDNDQKNRGFNGIFKWLSARTHRGLARGAGGPGSLCHHTATVPRLLASTVVSTVMYTVAHTITQ